MTAAVSSCEPELEPQPGHVYGPTTDAERPAQRVPYLTAVPDCEPPFDDDAAARATSDSTRPKLFRQPLLAPGDPHRSTTAIRAPSSAVAPAVLESTNTPTATRVTTSPSDRVAADPTSDAPGDVSRLASIAAGGPTTITSHSVPKWSSEADIGVRLTASENLPPAKRTGSVLARALVEVFSGRRPVAQLRVHCAPEIYAGLLDRPRTGPLSLPHLLTVRVCEPADGVAEVSAAFRRADRVRALAFRIQGVDGRWRITALQLG